ncbi:hypothetical protein Tco_0163804, partial [Tanacetum coccineum]
MAESSSHDPFSPKITPKEEHVTLDKPKSPNPFLHADQIKFTFEEIAFTTNNEVALLYPSHPNSEYFREVSDFISKCCLKEAFIKALTQYKEYLSEFWNALRAHYLPHSSMYVSPPSITIVRPWFATIGGKTGGLDQISNKDATILYCLENEVKVDYAKLIWEDIIHKLSKKTREKVFPYPRFISLLLEYMMPEYDNEELTINPTQVFSVQNWALKPNQTEGPPFTNHMKAICNLDVRMDSKALKNSSQTSSAKDKSLSHPSPPTPVVGEMHKEAHQAAGGPTSLGATSKEGVRPQLSSGHDASADSIAEADPGLSAPKDSIPEQQDQTKSAGDGLKTVHTDSGINEESRADDISKKIKLEDLLDLLKD